MPGQGDITPAPYREVSMKVGGGVGPSGRQKPLPVSPKCELPMQVGVLMCVCVCSDLDIVTPKPPQTEASRLQGSPMGRCVLVS
jgi:hypothetical protein